MWKIVGHERAIRVLQRAISGNSVPPSLLLTGPSGIGKTRLALELAKALNCSGSDAPCQVCIHCRQIEAGSHPDVTVLERLDGKDSIAIGQVRELREAVALRPFQGRWKIYIIAGAETLTPQAADALLKTLEEPQPRVSIVLTAIEAEALPATVVSRCQVLALGGVEAPLIRAALEQRGRSRDEAERLARLAQGNVGWALQAVEQPKLAAIQEEMVDQLSRVMDLDLDARLQLAESLTANRKDRAALRRQVEILALLARDLLLLSQDLPAQLVSGAQGDTLARQASRLGLAGAHAYLQKLRLTMARIDQNVDPRLALEALLVSLP